MAQEKIQLPKPTGFYNVGISTHFLNDTTSHYNDKKSRPLLVHIYYPSIETQKEYPRYLWGAMHLYKEKLARSFSPEDLEYLDEISDWAMLDAPIYKNDSPFPVIFFSPGFLMAAQLYSSLIEEIASHGYVIVAINHTDACWPVVFPDGSSPMLLPELVNVFSNQERSYLQTFDMTQETWIKDIEFVLSWLQTQPLSKSFNFLRMGIFGHSFGGSAAIEAARQNKNFKAVASLDSMLFGPNWNKSFETPSLFVAAEKQLTHEEALYAGLTIEQCDGMLARRFQKVFDQLKKDSFYVTVKDTEHASFMDSKLIKSPLYKSKMNPLKGIEIARALLVDFFDYYLRNKNLSVLNNQSTDIVVTKK